MDQANNFGARDQLSLPLTLNYLKNLNLKIRFLSKILNFQNLSS